MALNRTPKTETANTAANANVAAPEFETESAAPAAIEAAAAASVSATTAIAKAAVSSMAVVPKKAVAALVEFENNFSIDDVRSMGVGALPKVIAGGSELDIEGEDAVKKAVVELQSWNRRWLVTPGSDSDEAKKLLKTSYDNATLEDDHRSVKEYIQFLKESEGYDKASAREYIDAWGLIVSKDGVEVPPAERQLYQFQLSPQSVKKFNAFRLVHGIKVGQGLVQASANVTVGAEKQEFGGKKFSNMTFASA